MPTAEHLPTADEMGMKGRRACEIVGSKSCALRCAGAEAACESGLVSVRSFRPPFDVVRRSPLSVFRCSSGSVITWIVYISVFTSIWSPHGQGRSDTYLPTKSSRIQFYTFAAVAGRPQSTAMGMKGRAYSCALRCAGAVAACVSGLVAVRRFPLRFNTVRKESIIRIYRQDWNRHYIENIYPYLRGYAISMYRDNLTRICQHNPAFCTCRSGRPAALLGDGDPIGA